MDPDARRLGAEDEPSELSVPTEPHSSTNGSPVSADPGSESPAGREPTDSAAAGPAPTTANRATTGPEFATRPLILRRPYPLPRAIVWDALVDPVLVSGWLGELDIEPSPGGSYRLRYSAPAPRHPHDLSSAVIRDLAEPEVLALETGEGHEVRVRLEDVPGGPRNRSTILHLTVSAPGGDPRHDPAPDEHRDSATQRDAHPAAFAETVRLRAAWLLHFDQLDDLLHGRPVDGSSWSDVQDEAWLAHLADSAQAEREPLNGSD